MGVGLVPGVVAAYVGIPFFGACAAYALYRLFVVRPSVVVDDQGITDNATASGAGFIAWEEIDRIAVYTFNGQSLLGIYPKDLHLMLARKGWLKQTLIRLNRWPGLAPINIPQIVLPITVDELAKRITAAWAPSDLCATRDNK